MRNTHLGFRATSSFAAWDTSNMTEPYIEQIGVLATAVNEALVQDYDGVLRIAPAWPTAWNVTGTVFIRGQSRVHVAFRDGALLFAVLEAGSSGSLRIRNPWTGQETMVVGDAGQLVVNPTADGTLSLNVEQGRFYLIKRESDPSACAARTALRSGTAPLPALCLGHCAAALPTLFRRKSMPTATVAVIVLFGTWATTDRCRTRRRRRPPSRRSWCCLRCL
jgi:hypothetical protein